MSDVIDPPYVAQTLAWCNGQRALRDLPPLDCLPLGVQSDPESCPCGKATGLYVDETRYANTRVEWFGGDHLRHPLPAEVIIFVTAFDQGLLPQYEAEVLDDPDQY